MGMGMMGRGRGGGVREEKGREGREEEGVADRYVMLMEGGRVTMGMGLKG